MRKKLSVILIAAIAACGCFIATFSAAAENVANKPTVYKYALLGDTYTVDNELIAAYTPTGESISADAKTVFLDWSQGSYTFEYRTRVVNLKVYESAPKDEVIYGGEIPTELVAGEKTYFPTARVVSGIRRTDGAPEVGEYAVDATFWHKGVKAYSERISTEEIGFTPTEGGLWLVSYRYTDVFGRERSIDTPFNVENKRIILTDIVSEYYVGNSINLSETYGYYGGVKTAVSAVILLPSGETENVGDEYVFPVSGNYTLTLSAEIEGETVEKNIGITVKTELNSFVTDKNGFSEGTAFTNHTNVAGVKPEGLLFDMTASGSGFRYNGIIDLKKTGKNLPVISFTTNNSYGGSLSTVDVTLTDVYDSKRAVTIRFNKNSDITETSMSYDNTLVHASFGSVSTAFNNYYPLKGDAVAWDTRFSTYWLSPSYVNPDKSYEAEDRLYPMNFYYDTEDNCVYSYGNYSWVGRPDGSESGEKLYKIADLNSSSLPVKFEGFTTGEVYLSFKAVSGRGDVVIQSIGGKTEVTDEDYNTNDGLLTGPFDNTVPAVKNIAYPLRTYQDDFIKNLKVTVKPDGGEETTVEGGSFVPEKAGNYTVTFSGVNVFGKEVFKTFNLECKDEKIATVIDYDTSDAVAFGSVYEVKAPAISGGHGEVSYKLYYLGEEVLVGDKIAIEDENAGITVKTVDKLGFTAEKTFALNVNKDTVSFTVDFPRTAIKGENFTFPKAEAKYFLTGENLAYEIYLDGVKVGDTAKLPTDKNSVTVEYRTERGSKEFTLYLKSDKITKGGDAIIFDGTSETTAEGVKINLAAGENTVKLPYKLSPNALRCEFFVLAKEFNFNAFSMLLSNEKGVAVKITLKNLKNDEPNLYINGEDTGVKIIKRKQTFSSDAESGLAGEDYYAFSILYENRFKAVLNGNQILSYIGKDTRGVEFTGFDGGVYADLTAEETSGNVSFVLTRMSNQLFYSSAFASGDITGPALYSSKIRLGNANVSENYELDLSDIKAFDVLQKSARVALTLTAPDGTIVFDNLSPEAAGKRVLDKIGTYLLRVVATDEAGARTNSNFRISVEDEAAPELAVGGEIVGKVRKGDTVKVCGATATDETATTIKVMLIRPDGKTETLAEGSDRTTETSFKANIAGEYKIIYLAEDARGNVASKIYTVVAEE